MWNWVGLILLLVGVVGGVVSAWAHTVELGLMVGFTWLAVFGAALELGDRR